MPGLGLVDGRHPDPLNPVAVGRGLTELQLALAFGLAVSQMMHGTAVATTIAWHFGTAAKGVEGHTLKTVPMAKRLRHASVPACLP